MNLKVLDGGALDGLGSLLDQSGDYNCALGADGTAELDHLLAQLLASRNDSLNGAEVLAQIQESQLCRLAACTLNPASEGDFLVNVVGDVLEVHARDARGLEGLRAGKRKLAVRVLGDIFGVGSLLFCAVGEFASLCCGLLLCLAGELVTGPVMRVHSMY